MKSESWVFHPLVAVFGAARRNYTRGQFGCVGCKMADSVFWDQYTFNILVKKPLVCSIKTIKNTSVSCTATLKSPAATNTQESTKHATENSPKQMHCFCMFDGCNIT